MNRLKISILIVFIIGFYTKFPSIAHASLLDPQRTGSLTIQSLAEEEGREPAPTTGEAVDTADLEPLENIRYTLIRVEESSDDPATASPVEGEDAYRMTETTDETGRAVFGQLDQGVYLVRQEENPALAQRVEDFLVSVPMTNPGGTGWIYDVYVYPKYQVVGAPGMDLFVTQAGNRYDSAALLDEVTWIAACEIPADIAAARSYQVELSLHDYLTHREGDVRVSARSESGQTALDRPDDYTLSSEERQVTVSLTADGRGKLAQAREDGAALHIEIDTLLDIPVGELEEAMGRQIGIQAALRYTGSVGSAHTAAPEGIQPYVYTGGIGIVKYRGGGDQPLEGASFQLYRSLEDASAGRNPLKAPGSNEDWVVTTDENGAAFFHGVPYGGLGIPVEQGERQYHLVQTRAPAGYNLLPGPVNVAVDAASHLEENRVVVRGRAGFLLPATGGMGTVWFTLLGLLLIGAALFCLIRSRRKRGDERREER